MTQEEAAGPGPKNATDFPSVDHIAVTTHQKSPSHEPQTQH